MIQFFHDFGHRSSILDDYSHYERMERDEMSCRQNPENENNNNKIHQMPLQNADKTPVFKKLNTIANQLIQNQQHNNHNTGPAPSEPNTEDKKFIKQGEISPEAAADDDEDYDRGGRHRR